MNSIDYFKLGLTNDWYQKQEWIIKSFALALLPSPNDIEQLEITEPTVLKDHKHYYYFDGSKTEVIEDADVNKPLLSVKQSITLLSNELANVDKKIETTVGAALYNAICLVFAFGDTIKFVDDPNAIKIVEKQIANRLVDETDPIPEGKVVPSQHMKYLSASYSLRAYSTLFVPTATEYTIQPSPKALKRRDELFKIHQHELNNPTVVAAIAKEIEELDREWIAQDPNAGFYQKGKYFSIVRMRKFYMHGLEFDFSGTKATFIPNSLEEGWDIDKLPHYANSVREGSHNRGVQTALGGKVTKDIIQMTSGSTVAIEDCETKLGIEVTLTEELIPIFINSYIQTNKGPVLLTSDNADDYKNLTIIARSPGYCNAEGHDVCLKCMGEFVRGKEDALPAISAEIGHTLMMVFMSAMHGTKLQTQHYDLIGELR